MLFGICCLLAASAHAAPVSVKADVVPSWFRENPAKPYAILNAAKYLTDLKAVVYLGEQWHTLGGRLEDTQGHPLPFCRLTISDYGFRSYNANLRTDANGYFLVYSPYRLNGCTFSAIPGYPDTELASRYAASQNDVKTCTLLPLYQTTDRAFYRLTIDGHSKYGIAGFEKFSHDFDADLTKQEQLNEAPALPDQGDGKIHGPGIVITTTYPLRLIDGKGQPLKHALISLGVFGIGAALTDRNGRASFTETVEDTTIKESGYRRVLMINAPGSSFGPVSVTLNPETTTTIKLENPATVKGQIRDVDGLPASKYLTISYLSPSLSTRGSSSFGPHIVSHSDGTFSFSRILPNQPFRITGNDSGWQTTPAVPIESPVLILKPGQTYPNIHLQSVQPAALRGIVTNMAGQPLMVGRGADQSDPNHIDLTLLLPDAPANPDYGGHIGEFSFEFPREVVYEGTGTWVWGDPGPSFGFSGMGAGPFRLRTRSENYETYLSEPIYMKPGELRFFRIVLRPKTVTEKSSRKSSL